MMANSSEDGPNDSTQSFRSQFAHECFIPEAGFKPEGSLSERKCGKNPGHKGFIPINKLQKSDLPSDWHRDEVFDFFQIHARLTARIRAKFVSPNRPNFLRLSPSMKPGRKATWYGTGWVCKKPMCAFPCDCGSCPGPGPTLGYKIVISTAAHVLMDSLEAAQADVEFYADNPDDTSSVVTLSGWKVLGCDVDADWCRLQYVLHDRSLFQRIDQDFDLKCQKTDAIREISEAKHLPYHFVVSHPHGYSKQISFGQNYGRAGEGKETYYHYDTPTCAGSSGAEVFDDMSLRFIYGFFNASHHGTDLRNRSCTYPGSMP